MSWSAGKDPSAFWQRVRRREFDLEWVFEESEEKLNVDDELRAVPPGGWAEPNKVESVLFLS